MSERERQRRLHVENRLAELRSRYGTDIEHQPLPDWLDSLEGYQAALARGEAVGGPVSSDPTWGPLGSLARRCMSPAEVEHILAQDREMGVNHAPERPSSGIDAPAAIPQAPAQNHVLSASEAMRHIDRYGETPLFACPGCGEDSAKASTALDYWRCTQCGAWGKASKLAPPPDSGWTTPVHVA